MMVLKKNPRSKVVATLVAAFGTAMASQYVVHNIQADEIDLSFTPGSILFNSYFPQGVDIDELALGFMQWNDSAGKTMYAGSLTSINMVEPGAVLSPGTFTGAYSLFFTAFQSSSAYVGFRSAGNVGWFRLDLGGIGSPINYVGGVYGSDGEQLTVGGGKVLRGDVNCDGAVNLLDVQPFIDLLTSGKYLDKADMNNDGAVNLLDVAEFVDAISD